MGYTELMCYIGERVSVAKSLVLVEVLTVSFGQVNSFF